ncbi:MAG: hypothetical protein C0598_01010 [Marinilabiliales bacterium]|nr:MAG: hypothetical protein C0598_01010 [Marinilabiliales bacterium]
MKHLLSILFLLSFSGLFCQTTITELKVKSEEKYGPDDILINGISYIPLHPSANGNPFFGENTFITSYINLKGRDFKNVLLKYDIEQQVVILKVNESYGGKKINLSNNYIKDFVINNKHFVNINEFDIEDEYIKFLELVYMGDFIFGNYYSKNFLAVYSNKYPYGKYTKTKVSKYLFLNGKKYFIKNKGDILSLFPEHKHDIKKFIKKNKIKFRKATNDEFFKLMQYCDELN